MYHWYYTNEFSSVFVVVLFSRAVLCYFLSLPSLISKFFESYANIKVKCKLIKTPLTSKIQKVSIHSSGYSCNIYTGLCSLRGCVLVISIVGEFGTESSSAAMNVCVTIVFYLSFVNALLYYRRIKEIRDSNKDGKF